MTRDWGRGTGCGKRASAERKLRLKKNGLAEKQEMSMSKRMRALLFFVLFCAISTYDAESAEGRVRRIAIDDTPISIPIPEGFFRDKADQTAVDLFESEEEENINFSYITGTNSRNTPISSKITVAAKTGSDNAIITVRDFEQYKIKAQLWVLYENESLIKTSPGYDPKLDDLSYERASIFYEDAYSVAIIEPMLKQQKDVVVPLYRVHMIVAIRGKVLVLFYYAVVPEHNQHHENMVKTASLQWLQSIKEANATVSPEASGSAQGKVASNRVDTFVITVEGKDILIPAMPGTTKDSAETDEWIDKGRIAVRLLFDYTTKREKPISGTISCIKVSQVGEATSTPEDLSDHKRSLYSEHESILRESITLKYDFPQLDVNIFGMFGHVFDGENFVGRLSGKSVKTDNGLYPGYTFRVFFIVADRVLMIYNNFHGNYLKVVDIQGVIDDTLAWKDAIIAANQTPVQ